MNVELRCIVLTSFDYENRSLVGRGGTVEYETVWRATTTELPSASFRGEGGTAGAALDDLLTQIHEYEEKNDPHHS